jgi:hypothetical protein
LGPSMQPSSDMPMLTNTLLMFQFLPLSRKTSGK